MKGIFEIRFHGRGGQGAKTAAQLVAEAALESGKNIQAFPEFGPERSGAPVASYVRISDKPIKTYAAVTNPDVVIVIEPTLIGPINVIEGLGKDGVLIVNTSKAKDEIKEITKFNGQIYAVDATKISTEEIGKNLPNTPMIGALVKVTNIVSLDSISKKIKDYFLEKIGEEKTNANIRAIKRAYDEVE